MENKVNFFIVGQPKCGTTSMYHYFKKHKEVFLPKQKQLYFFAKDHNEHRKKHSKYNTDHYSNYYNFKFEDYISRFNFQKKFSVYGDITPDYIYSKTAPIDIYSYNKKAKILIILREPLEFLKSFHNQLINSGREYETDFYKALSYQEIRENKSYKNNEQSPHFYFQYDKLVDYLSIVKSYHLIFKNNLKIVLYEDFKSDNVTVLNMICDFLEISRFDNLDIIESNISIKGSNKFSQIINNKTIQLLMSLIPRKVKLLSKEMLFKYVLKKRNEFLVSGLDLKLQKRYHKNVKELNNYLITHNLILNGKNINLIDKWRDD